jgi:hypothetical protein
LLPAVMDDMMPKLLPHVLPLVVDDMIKGHGKQPQGCRKGSIESLYQDDYANLIRK